MKRIASFFRLMLRRCWRESGASVPIEYVFALPIFVVLILATIEFGLVLFLRSALEGVTRDVSRLGITGYTYDSGDPRSDFLFQRLNERARNVVFVPDGVMVESEIFTSFDQALGGSGNRIDTASGFGGSANQLIRYTVSYEHEFLTPLAAMANNMEGSLTIMSTAFVKNEDNDF